MSRSMDGATAPGETCHNQHFPLHRLGGASFILIGEPTSILVSLVSRGIPLIGSERVKSQAKQSISHMSLYVVFSRGL